MPRTDSFNAPMRRKDREMNTDFGMMIIDKSRYGVLSMVDDCNEPYSIPLSIARAGNNLYFHSAMEGKKVKLFSMNPTVTVVFVGETKIPDNYSEHQLDEMIKDYAKASLLLKNVFTTEYESAIIKGCLSSVENLDERIEAMRLICEKYTPSKMKYFQKAINTGLGRTNIYKIEIHHIKAKRKKYNSQDE